MKYKAQEGFRGRWSLKAGLCEDVSYFSAVASLLLKRYLFPYAARCEKSNVKNFKLFRNSKFSCFSEESTFPK